MSVVFLSRYTTHHRRKYGNNEYMVDFYTDVRPDTAQQNTTHISIRFYFVRYIHTGVRPFAVVFVIAAPYVCGFIGVCVRERMCARMFVFRMYVSKGCTNRRSS